MTTYTTSREIPALVDAVFAAFTDPQRLARWWGPSMARRTFPSRTDIHTSKTGAATITVVQKNGERFKTLAENVEVA